jgi:hypothetical protein
MEEGKIVLTVEQWNKAIGSLKNTFQEGVEVLEILENATIKNKAVEYLIEAEESSDVSQFTWETIVINRKKIGIVRYEDAISVESVNLIPNGLISEAEAFASGKKIRRKTRKYLQEEYFNKETDDLNWEKAKGLAWETKTVWLETHWYQHKDLGKGENSVGAVELKEINPPIMRPDNDVMIYLKAKERIFMEHGDLIEDEHQLVHRENKSGVTPVEVTKENVLSRFKPASDTQVFMENGTVITSEPVLAVIKELKECIEKNDVDRFSQLLDEVYCENSLTLAEGRQLGKAVITDKGTTVADFIFDLDDILGVSG